MAAKTATPTTPTATKSNGIRTYYCDDIRYDVKCFNYIALLWIRLTLGVLPQSARAHVERWLRSGGRGGQSRSGGASQEEAYCKRILTSQYDGYSIYSSSKFIPKFIQNCMPNLFKTSEGLKVLRE